MENNIFVFTTSTQYINQGLSELQEADSSVRSVKLFENGIAIISTKNEKKDFLSAIEAKKPVFVRHINAVDYIIGLENGEFKNIVETIGNYSDRIAKGQRVAVQVRKGSGEYPYNPVDVKSAIDVVLEENMGAIPEVKEPEKIISILLCDDKCYIGLGTPYENISAWSGGMVHYKKSEEDISKAKYKLMEAIEVFHIDMGSFRYALDLGAAPGGWTSVMLEHGLRVTAVDTGDMDSRLSKLPRFKFVKADASALELEHTNYDVLTLDANWSPKSTAKIINNASKYLKSGAIAVVTVKLMGDKVRKTIKEVTAIYREVFDVLDVKQLFHNKDEVTLYLKKR
jgi:23S rRNA (cytidine2498-2'-O)-methyltransferase